MIKTSSKFILFQFLIAVIIASSVSFYSAMARPEYVKILPSELKNFCIVCHETNAGGSLNQFGEDYARMDLVQLLKMDSDGDGYSNHDELNAGMFPGDPDSYPGADGINRLLLLGVQGILIISVFLIYRYELKSDRRRFPKI